MTLPWSDNPYGFSTVPGAAQCIFDAAVSAGFSAMRVIHDFVAIDTVGNPDPTTWFWDIMDSDVQLAYANGLNYTFVLSNVGSWGQSIAPGSACRNPTIDATYALFVVQTVLNRYNGGTVPNAKIARIELGNEGYDDNGVGDPCDSFEDLVLVLKNCYPWIKANFPDVLVGTAAHFNRQPSDVTSVQLSLYTGRNGSAAGYFDYSNYHWYGTVNLGPNSSNYTGPDGPQANGKDTFNQEWIDIHAVDVLHNPVPPPVYCTETGIGVPGGNGLNTEAQKSCFFVGGNCGAGGAFTTGVLQDGLNSGGVLTHVFIWTIKSNDTESIIHGCTPWVPLPAFMAIQTFIAQNPQWTPSTPSDYALTIEGDTPQAYYRLDEASGTTAIDQTSNHYNGTYTGCTLNQPGGLLGDPDTCVLTNGTSDYVALPSGLNTAGWSAISLEAWINPANVVFGNTARVVANDAPSNTNLGVELAVQNTAIIFKIGTGSTAYSLTYTFAFAASTWYYVAGVFDGTHLYIYLNGVQVATSTVTSATIGSTANVLYISRNPVDTTNGFPGDIDEVAVYNTALTSTKISNHYAASGRGVSQTSGSILLPAGVRTDNWTSITVECWLKLSNTSFTTTPTIIANSLPGTAHTGYSLSLDALGAGIHWKIGNGTTNADCHYVVSLVAGTWYHIVGTWDGTTLTIYVNGVSHATATLGGRIAVAGNASIIGHNPLASNDYLPATLDEIALYKSALPSGRVLAHYNAGVSP